MFYIWLAVIVLCLLLELVTLNCVTISFAAGGLLALLSEVFHFDWWLQLVIFALFFGCMVVLLTPFLRKKLLPDRADKDIYRRY